ncbi:hypothetical protein Emag_004314 [Eimeria magna]
MEATGAAITFLALSVPAAGEAQFDPKKKLVGSEIPPYEDFVGVLTGRRTLVRGVRALATIAAIASMAVALFLVLQCLRSVARKAGATGATERFLAAGRGGIGDCSAGPPDDDFPSAATSIQRAMSSAAEAVNVLTPTWIKMLDLRRQLLEANYRALENWAATHDKDEPLQSDPPVIKAIAEMRSGLEVAQHSHSDLRRFVGFPFSEGNLAGSLGSLETLMTKAALFVRELVSREVTLWRQRVDAMEEAEGAGRAGRGERQVLMEDAIAALAALRLSSGLDLDLN